ncbi:MAG: 30S ribosomal protein S6 [Aggregatilineales bacterium]
MRSRIDVFPKTRECLSASGWSPDLDRKHTQGKESTEIVRKYELPLIIPSDVADDAVNGIVQTVQGWIEAGSGQVTEVNMWGRRHLAYQIGESREATYVLIKADMQPQAINELERNLRLDQQILRHLVVRLDD